MILAFGLFLLLTIPLGVFAWMLLTDPPQWEVVDKNDPVAVNTARSTENEFGSRFSHVYPIGQRWEYRVTPEQVNAWLGVRLQAWLLNQNAPPEDVAMLDRLRIVFKQDRFELAWQTPLTEQGWANPIASLVFTLGQSRNGVVTVSLDSARLGTVPVPLDWLMEQAASNNEVLGDMSDKLKDKAAAIESKTQAIPLEMPLLDGRKVTVVGIAMTPDLATFTCVTNKAN